MATFIGRREICPTTTMAYVAPTEASPNRALALGFRPQALRARLVVRILAIQCQSSPRSNRSSSGLWWTLANWSGLCAGKAMVWFSRSWQCQWFASSCYPQFASMGRLKKGLMEFHYLFSSTINLIIINILGRFHCRGLNFTWITRKDGLSIVRERADDRSVEVVFACAQMAVVIVQRSEVCVSQKWVHSVEKNALLALTSGDNLNFAQILTAVGWEFGWLKVFVLVECNWQAKQSFLSEWLNEFVIISLLNAPQTIYIIRIPTDVIDTGVLVVLFVNELILERNFHAFISHAR